MKTRRTLAALALACSLGCGSDSRRVEYTTTNDLLREGAREAYELELEVAGALSWRKDGEGGWHIRSRGRWQYLDLRDPQGYLMGDSSHPPSMRISLRDYAPWSYEDPALGFSWPLEMGEEDVIEIEVHVEEDTYTTYAECFFRGPWLVPSSPIPSPGHSAGYPGVGFLGDILPHEHLPDPAKQMGVLCSRLKETVADRLAYKLSRKE